MTRLQEKAQAQTKQIIGQMVGDEELVREGREQQRRADRTNDATQTTEEHQNGSDPAVGAPAADNSSRRSDQ